MAIDWNKARQAAKQSNKEYQQRLQAYAKQEAAKTASKPAATRAARVQDSQTAKQHEAARKAYGQRLTREAPGSAVSSGRSNIAKTVVSSWETDGQRKLRELARRVTQEHDEAENTRGFGDRVKRALSVAGKNAMGAVGGLNASVASTADFLLPDFFTPQPVQKVLDYYKDSGSQFKEAARRENRRVGGQVGEVIGDLSMSALETMPQTALALMTGGSSTTAQAANALANAGRTLTGTQMLTNLIKNPSFGMSAARMIGPEYDQAKADGADELQATLYALAAGMVNAGIEVGSGVETIGQTAPGLRNWARAAGEEGLEEVKQGIVSALGQKGIYAPDTPWVSLSDDRAVVNPARAAQEFAGGAIVGGLLGAPANLVAAHSSRNYDYLSGQDGGRTPDFDAQWNRYNQAGQLGIPIEQVQPYPTATPVGQDVAYGAHAAGMNDYAAAAQDAAQRVLAGETVADGALDKALSHAESRAKLEDAVGQALPEDYAEARQAVRDWQSTQKSAVETSETEQPVRKPGLNRENMPNSVDAQTADAIDRIGRRTGVEIRFDSDIRSAGTYQDGVITIRPDAENPVRQVFVHELTHHLEQSGDYQVFSDHVTGYMSEKGTLEDARAYVRKRYAAQGVTLDDTGVDRELVAEFCDTTLFTDSDAIARLAQTKRGIAQRIRDWLHDMAVRLRGTAEEKFILEAEKRYRRALASVDGQKKSAPDGTQYKIEALPDGKKYVKADRQVITGDDPSQWSAQAERFINDKIRENGDLRVYTQDGFAVDITERSAYKLTDTHVQSVSKVNREQLDDAALAAKMRAAGHIDELTETARWKRWRPDVNQSHRNDVGESGFDYFTTYFEDENGEYYRVRLSAGVNPGVGVSLNDDTDTAYSIGDMAKRRRPSDNGSSASPAGNGALNARTSSNISISDSSQNSNPDAQSVTKETQNDGGQNKLDGSDYFTLLRQAGHAEAADALARAVRKNGAIARGEFAARDVKLPKQMNDETRVRRFARTAAESAVLNDEQAAEIGKMVAEGRFNYEPIGDRGAVARAEARIAADPDQALRDWQAAIDTKRWITKNDIALGELLLKQAAESGDTEAVIRLTAEVAAAGTSAGQVVQAMRLLKQMGGAGQLVSIETIKNRYQKDLDARYGKKAPNLNIPDDLKQALMNATTEDEINAAKEAIFQCIAEQIPSSAGDKWNAWRYLSMLGNPRTHIRNVLGNAMFEPMVATKNLLGAIAEEATDAANKAVRGKGIERTKSLHPVSPEIKAFAKADYAEMKDIVQSGGKYNDAQKIDACRRIFTGSNPVSRAVEWARKANGGALEFEDGIFLGRHYVNALASYLTANHVDAQTLADKSPDSQKILDHARAYAIREAQRATYRDASQTAEVINLVSRQAPGPVRMVVEGVLPFKKTPLNILKRGIEYSPAGLLKAFYKGFQGARNGKYTANEVIDDLAASLTGTGLLAVGYLATSLGFLTGGGDEEDESKWFRDMLGYQSYALQIGDKSYTLDWAAPGSMPLFVGSELFQLVHGGKLGAGDLLSAMERLTAPMNNMSMLYGLNDTLDHLAYRGDTSNALMNLFTDSVISYFSQAVPTLLGQIARTADGTRRTTYADKNNQIPDTIEKAVQKAGNKIPFLSKKNPAYINLWGETEATDNPLYRLASNMFSPGYADTVEMDALDKELLRLYDQTGENVFPDSASRYIRVNGETKRFTVDAYQTYAATLGQTSHKMLYDLTSSALYQKADDADKASAVDMVYKYADALAKTGVSDYEMDGWYAKARDAQSVGLSPDMYILYKLVLNTVDSEGDGNGSISQSEAAAAIQSMPGLTKKQKAYLWQSQNKAWSPKNNPFA